MRKAVVTVVVWLMAVAQAGAVTFSESTGSDLPGRASGGAPRLVAGPYVQNMTTTGVTIMWQTDIPSTAKLSIHGGIHEDYVTSRTRRLSEVRITGLAPGTSYTYSLRPLGSTDGNAEASFRTFPAKDEPVKFIVYGDTRSEPARHKQVIDAMDAEHDVSFVLHTGDVVNRGSELKLWIPTFFGPARRMIRTVPFYFELGNHEGNSPNYFKYFALPGGERWYSFDVGEIHVIGLDSNTSFEPGSAQYKWLIGDLETHKRAGWKFVFMHHPTYTSGTHGSVNLSGVPKEAPIRTAQELFPDLARKYGIRAIFSGHDHAYERSVRDGVSYVVSGGGGAPSYGEPNAAHNPYRRVFYSGTHYCVISVNGNSARMVARTPAGKIIDQTDL
ncbi:MAG: metallophosphoesterase family protein [Armatimonadetes bacterium]|nr:metallophosphoesterase family protein [Armatimonadota bacterium]